MGKYPPFQGGRMFKVLGYAHYTLPKIKWLKKLYYRRGRHG